MMQMLVRCLYASRPTPSLSGTDHETILEQSRRNNHHNGVTGLLCVSDDLFIQVLEGGRDEVCNLFGDIMRDPRHQGVRLLVYEEISQRRFGNWTMGKVAIAKLNPSLLLKYFRRKDLDPFDCSGQATMSLLGELVDTASILNRTE